MLHKQLIYLLKILFNLFKHKRQKSCPLFFLNITFDITSLLNPDIFLQPRGHL